MKELIGCNLMNKEKIEKIKSTLVSYDVLKWVSMVINIRQEAAVSNDLWVMYFASQFHHIDVICVNRLSCKMLQPQQNYITLGGTEIRIGKIDQYNKKSDGVFKRKQGIYRQTDRHIVRSFRQNEQTFASGAACL